MFEGALWLLFGGVIGLDILLLLLGDGGVIGLELLLLLLLGAGGVTGLEL